MKRLPSVMLGDLSWPEVKDALDEVRLVLIPVGSFEQHGYNTGLRTDTANVEKVCKMVAERLNPRVLVTPAIPFGISFHHMDFPGTITLEEDTLIATIEDMARSLSAHGFKRVLLVNGHGGNRMVVNEAAVRIYRRAKLVYAGGCTWVDPGGTGAGHGAVIETSLTMYLTPELVKWDDLREGRPVGRRAEIAEAERKGVHKPVEGLDRVVTPWRAKLISDTGTGPPGDMKDASAERGEEFVERAIATLVEMCLAISTGDYDLPVWEDYP